MESRHSTWLPHFGFLLAGFVVISICIGIYWFNKGKSVEDLMAEGNSNIDRRDFASAVESFEQAVKASPKLKDGWRSLADVTCRAGQPIRSQEALETLAELDPETAGKFGVQLARLWMSKNQIQPAIRALRLAAKANPRSPEPYRLMAQIFGVTAHRGDVVNCLMELIKRNAFNRNDLILLSSINPALDDMDRLKLILEADSSDKSPLFPLAMRELDRNHIDEAQEILIEITKSNPHDLEAQNLLGELYAEFRPENFLDWNLRLPVEAERDGHIWLARGKWLHRQGHDESAVRCLFEAVIRVPEDLSANVLLGQILKSQGAPELGSPFTERGRRLQRIMDLSSRRNEPRGDESIEPMIDDLEATGRLWEAWAWCFANDQLTPRQLEAIKVRRDRLFSQLNADVPRTKSGSLPLGDHDWQQYPLPDWSRLGNASATSDERIGQSTIRFEDDGERVGLDFRYANSSSQEGGRKIFETMGAGVAVIDYDQDGWPDLYFPQGKTLPFDRADGPSDALYRNHGGQRFHPVTEFAGIHETSFSQGVASGDFDNDGFPDIYIANMGRNCLYRNHGDGTFSDATEVAGLTQAVWTVSCAIADLNGDGLPELFDVNYVQRKDLLTATCFDEHRRPVVCRPTVFDPVLDTVLLNLGNGQFQELQKEAGLDLPLGMGLGLLIADYNDDGQQDVFIANDMTANFLLINDGTGPGFPLQFHDEAFQRGVAVDLNGLAQACMGVTSADINRDGQPDLFVTNFARESNTLYLSQPGGLYQDQTQRAGLREPSFDPLGFGTQFLDADNDGWHDLVVANGHIDEFVNEPFRMRAQIFRGHSDARFTELKAEQAGPLFDVPRLARGLALLDWNRDGRLDFVVTDLEQPILLGTNATENRNCSLRLRLIGTESSRDAIGAKIRVLVTAGDERVCQLTAGDGYESCNQRMITIGLGETSSVSRIEIRWPSGNRSQFEQVACDQVWLAIEGAKALIPETVQ